MTEIELLESQVTELKARFEKQNAALEMHDKEQKAKIDEHKIKIDRIEKWAWVAGAVALALGITLVTVKASVDTAKTDAAEAMKEASKAVADLSKAKADAIVAIKQVGPSMLNELRPSFEQWVTNAKLTIAPSLEKEVQAVKTALGGIGPLPGVAAGIIGKNGSIASQTGRSVVSKLATQSGVTLVGVYQVTFNSHLPTRPFVIVSTEPGAQATLKDITVNGFTVVCHKVPTMVDVNVDVNFVVVWSQNE